MSIDRTSKVPLYQQLKDIIEEKIESGEIKPGDKLPSESELITQYGVSRQVVRQTMAELASEGRIYREQGKGSFCLSTQSKESKQIRIIAVIIVSITEGIYPQTIRGIEDVAQQHSYGVVLSHSDNDFEKEALYLRNYIKNRIDGLIIDLSSDIPPYPNLKYLQEMENRNIPFVMIDKHLEGPNYNYVHLDDENGLYLATKYLINLGHRRIAHLGSKETKIGDNRWRGYQRALLESGIPYDEELVPSKNRNLPLEEWISKVVDKFQSSKKGMPTAITCYNDHFAMRVMRKVKERGLKIPEDISIIGFDDDYLAKELDPPLTTVLHPSYEMGKKAAEILIDKIEGKESRPQQITFPARLVKRASCKRIR